MHFEEFHTGQVLRVGPYQVTEEEIVDFARKYDPQWFHTDADRAATSHWGGLIASGWHTCAIAMRMVCDGPLQQSESVGSPGLAYLKWSAPVRPNDQLSLEIHVLETRVASSKRFGILRWQWRMKNQDDVQVLDLEATSLFQVNKRV